MDDDNYESDPSSLPSSANTANTDTNTSTPLGDAYWSSEEALKSLELERSLHPEETRENLSRRLIVENIPQVTLSLIHTALHDPNGNTRTRAGMYLMDRALGKAGEDIGMDDPLQKMLETLATQAEEFANASASTGGESEAE